MTNDDNSRMKDTEINFSTNQMQKCKIHFTSYIACNIEVCSITPKHTTEKILFGMPYRRSVFNFQQHHNYGNFVFCF